jgi:hypothetical protein
MVYFNCPLLSSSLYPQIHITKKKIYILIYSSMNKELLWKIVTEIVMNVCSWSILFLCGAKHSSEIPVFCKSVLFFSFCFFFDSERIVHDFIHFHELNSVLYNHHCSVRFFCTTKMQKYVTLSHYLHFFFFFFFFFFF